MASFKKLGGLILLLSVTLISGLVAKEIVRKVLHPPVSEDDAARKGVEVMKAKLPIKVDDATTLVDVTYARHKFVVYDYLLDTKRYRFPANFIQLARKSAAVEACKAEAMRWGLDRGVTYQYRYIGSDFNDIGSFELRRSDCS